MTLKWMLPQSVRPPRILGHSSWVGQYNNTAHPTVSVRCFLTLFIDKGVLLAVHLDGNSRRTVELSNLVSRFTCNISRLRNTSTLHRDQIQKASRQMKKVAVSVCWENIGAPILCWSAYICHDWGASFISFLVSVAQASQIPTLQTNKEPIRTQHIKNRILVLRHQ